MAILFQQSVSELLGGPCNKSDIPVKLVTSCSKLVDNLEQAIDRLKQTARNEIKLSYNVKLSCNVIYFRRFWNCESYGEHAGYGRNMLWYTLLSKS